MQILQQFQTLISANVGKDDRVLLAVSGGMDSVVLCELCKQSAIQFEIAHCNFALRGEESERDEQFVTLLAEKYGIKLWVKKFDTAAFAEQNKLSIQEAARKLRYDWFYQLQEEQGFSYILLAHHADDNIETLLMNFFRGTGLQGLTGIPEKTSRLLRPMLHTRRSEILEFANDHHLQWVEDSSNNSSKYTRNFFRNEILPAIQKVYPGVAENLLDNIERFKKINTFYLSEIAKIKTAVCEQKGTELWIPFRKLKKHDVPVLIYEIIKPYGFGEKQVPEVIRLMESESGRFIENMQFQIIKHGLWLIIAPVKREYGLIPVDRETKEVSYENGKLVFTEMTKEKFRLQKNEEVAQLDLKHIQFPLVLRKWKQGDYFYPLGMRKKKKLSRFLIDLKLPKSRKENVWVLESNKKIIWVVGLRIDDRFKVSESTLNILVVTNEHKLVG
jgi:tRNA(Ile)-lysidine synthase